MNKPRHDCLFARLRTNARRDAVFSWIHEECMTYAEVAARIKEEFGLETNAPVLEAMNRRRGFEWRLRDSVRRAHEEASLLPEDHDERRKKALAQREFEAVLQNLSFKEIMIAQRLEMDREKLKLQQEMEPRKAELARRRVDLLEGKLSAAKETEASPTLTPAEKQERIRQIFGLA
jgi:hypothetical protein